MRLNHRQSQRKQRHKDLENDNKHLRKMQEDCSLLIPFQHIEHDYRSYSRELIAYLKKTYKDSWLDIFRQTAANFYMPLGLAYSPKNGLATLESKDLTLDIADHRIDMSVKSSDFSDADWEKLTSMFILEFPDYWKDACCLAVHVAHFPMCLTPGSPRHREMSLQCARAIEILVKATMALYEIKPTEVFKCQLEEIYSNS